MRRSRASASGLSLVETMMAAALMALVTGIAILGLSTGNKAMSQCMTREIVDDAAVGLMTATVTELRQASAETLDLGAGADAGGLSFRKVTGFDGTARTVSFGPEVRLEWHLGAAEAANGADDDGDGLLDEGTVSRTEGSGSARTVAVDVLLLRFQRGAAPRDDEVVVTVRTAARLWDGTTYARAISETVLVRN